MVDAIPWELLRAGGYEDKVALNMGIDNLGDDMIVCEADNKTVFGSVAGVTIKLLNNAAKCALLTTCSSPGSSNAFGHELLEFQCKEREGCDSKRTISLALPTATILDLETREVCA